jgi:AcrR family transcriptional regulator
MVQIAEQTRRGRGRPQVRGDEETRELLIQAARQEFQAKGYAGTCMNDVAQRAGVSTKTVYRLIPNKADLLQRVISDCGVRGSSRVTFLIARLGKRVSKGL